MTRPGRFAAAVALVAAAGAAGWWLISVQLAVGSLMAGVTTVTVADDAFAPDAIVVPAGTTVTWRWRGQHGHDLVAEEFSAPGKPRASWLTGSVRPARRPACAKA